MAGPRPAFVVATLASCALLAGLRLLLGTAEREVELIATELVHVQGGQDVLVLREKSGERRLPVPVARQDAVALQELLKGGSRGSLPGAAIAALEGRVLRVVLEDGSAARIELAVGSRTAQVSATASEAVALALRERVPIVIDSLALAQAGISPDDLRAVRAREPVPAPPVQPL